MTQKMKINRAIGVLATIAMATAPSIAQQIQPPRETGNARASEPPPLTSAPKPTAYKVKPAPKRSHKRKPHHPPVIGPRTRVEQANDAARIEPRGDGFINAIQKYPWANGALYQVYTAPGQITDIALQPGERLVGAGPVAAGDTVRWIIGDTTSGVGAAEQVHILIKPTRADLKTNMLINTDRRTYHIELRASTSTYMASVSWTYPQDELIAIQGRAAAANEAAPVATGIALPNLSFGYRISGDKPPVFVIGANGEGELVNYRVAGRHIIVDRLFAEAELRMGDRKSEQRVRIKRDGRERRR